VKRIAATIAELMRHLGYEHHGAGGDDRGASISRQLGLLDLNRILGGT